PATGDAAAIVAAKGNTTINPGPRTACEVREDRAEEIKDADAVAMVASSLSDRWTTATATRRVQEMTSIRRTDAIVVRAEACLRVNPAMGKLANRLLLPMLRLAWFALSTISSSSQKCR